MTTLDDDLRELLNRHSRENMSDTPDFILARYLMDCLAAFEAATRTRSAWHRSEATSTEAIK
jgi:hypothetical protein